MRMPWSKKSVEEREKEEAAKAKAEEAAYEAKIQAMRDSISDFQKELDKEDFVLRDNQYLCGDKKCNSISEAFERSFEVHLSKKGSSATKRWCRNVVKKLKKLDESIYAFWCKARKAYSDEEHENITLMGRKTSSRPKILEWDYREKIRIKFIKEFNKIFYNTTVFDNKFFGIPVKFTPSQTAAVNKVKKELNELCDPKNFVSKVPQ